MIYKEIPDVAIKSIKDRVIHGLGVRFGDATTKDSDNEFFVPESEVGLVNGANRPYILEHGFHPAYGVVKVGDAIYEKDGTGWAYETTFLDTPIGNKAYEEIKSKEYKSSAGAAGHTRRATQVGGAFRLDVWMIAEQSATLTPADPHNAQLHHTKSDYILFAIQKMNEQRDEQVKCLLTEIAKSGNESREKLANALMQLRNSFSTDGKSIVLDEALLSEIETLTKPVETLNYGIN